MNINEEMVALRGSKQINTTGSLVEETFWGFAVGEYTAVEELWLDGVNVISNITDDPTADLMIGEVFRIGRGKVFSGIKITRGAVILYLDD